MAAPWPNCGRSRATPAHDAPLRGRDAFSTEFLAAVIDAGLLLESGVPGLYGHGAQFEQVRLLLAARLSAEAASQGAETLHFPPLLPRRDLEAAGYLTSFPHLAGTVYAFDRAHDQDGGRSLGRGGAEIWAQGQSMTEIALVPAACYPVYPALAKRGSLPTGGAYVDAGGAWVFRHERAADPGRRHIFHQHELVRVGNPEPVELWRDEWADRGLDLLTRLGLDVRLSVATDPFFGRQGRMLAAQQRDRQLKLELLLTIEGSDPMALASFNRHRSHFAELFEIRLDDGGEVHSACVGFGHERIVLAMLAAHGLDPAHWPGRIRKELWR